MTNTELKELRSQLKLSQAKMAEMLGLHKNHYQKLEYGTARLTKTLHILCKKLSGSKRL